MAQPTKDLRVSAVLLGEGGDGDGAAALSHRIGVPLLSAGDPLPAGVFVRFDADGASLTDGELTVRGDFSSLLPRLKRANLSSELLVRAVRFKGSEAMPYVIDATAGLGEDSFLLAAAGCRVRMYEYDPVIAALLSDALRRAAEDPGLSAVASRMELFCADSLKALPGADPAPDVVLLDPMFPERQKSGLVKKKFQLIHKLEAPCEAEEALLAAAKAACPRKIVVKRPAKGACLGGVKPGYSLEGKAIRYDVIVL